MPRFASKSPEQQAASVAKSLSKAVDKDSADKAFRSIKTIENYKERLEQVSRNMTEYGIKGEIRDLTPATAHQYLETRGQEIGQKTLDMERQAIQAMFTYVTGQLGAGEKLDVVKSEQAQALEGRAYTAEQVQMISSAQTDKNNLSTQLAYSAGLRAHELYTLAPVKEQAPTEGRERIESKFDGREGQIYTVAGKGGLVREVLIPKHLADKLEERRLEAPLTVNDRGVNYQSRYDINGGQKWSNSFSSASNRELNWSSGAHGCRHSYAQERMNELQNLGYTRDTALQTVSQELGHFRPEITEVYLR